MWHRNELSSLAEVSLYLLLYVPPASSTYCSYQENKGSKSVNFSFRNQEASDRKVPSHCSGFGGSAKVSLAEVSLYLWVLSMKFASCLALRNLRWLLDFLRIYGPLNYRISNLLWVSDVSGATANFESNGGSIWWRLFLPCSRQNTDSRNAWPLLVCEIRMLKEK